MSFISTARYFIIQFYSFLLSFSEIYHQSIVYSIVGNQNDLIVIEDGGMVDSEMKRLIIAPSFYQIEKEDFESG